MDIREFIRETLVQIVQGVSEAQKACAELSATVAPYATSGGEKAKSQMLSEYATGRTVEPVDFDIAVTVTETTTTGGKGGVGFYGLQVAGGRESATEQQSVSRVRFRTLIGFPDPREKPAKTKGEESPA